MSTSAIPFSPGATQTAENYNFLSTWDIIQTEKDPHLYERFGSGRLSGLLEFFGHKKPVSNMVYSHFEEDRQMPKIYATNAGAGSAGAAVTFTLNSAANFPYNQNNSPFAGSANAVNSYPVRKGDLIYIKPATGTVSFTTLVAAHVYSVNTTAGTFVAYPLDGGDAIPAVTSADEIIIFGNAHGEGSARPAGLVTKATEYTDNLHIFKDTYRATDVGAAMKTWVMVDGVPRWGMKGEKDAMTRILNNREMTLMFNPGLSNATISNNYATDGTPISMAKGVVQQIIERGNTLSYSAVTGITLADMEDLVEVMDKQKCSKVNLFCMGINLATQWNREFRDVTKNGAITYGMFSGQAAKNIDLTFEQVTVSHKYTFIPKVIDAFNDLQTLGASGFNFVSEGMILPADMKADVDGSSEPTIRMRYLQRPGGASEEMVTTYYDGRKYAADGEAVEEVRYSSICGIEVRGANRAVYVKKA